MTLTIVIQAKLAQLNTELHIMKDYMIQRQSNQDWHGVMDAACDIREITAKLSVLNEILTG